MNFSYKFLIFGVFTGIIYLFANISKVYLIQKYRISTLTEESTIALVVLTFIIFSQKTDPINYFIMLPFIGACFSLMIYDIKKVYLLNKFYRSKLLYIILFIACFFLIGLIPFFHEIDFKNLLFKFCVFSFFSLILYFFGTKLKCVFSNFNSLLFLSCIFLFWIFFIGKYLHLLDINIYFYIFFSTFYIAQYLYTNICKFINICFMNYVFFWYLLSSILFFTL